MPNSTASADTNGHHPPDFAFSIIANAYDKAPPTETSLASFYEEITSLRWFAKIEHIRAVLEKDGEDAAKKLKALLPAALPSGTFSYRANENLTRHNAIIHVDLDKLGAQTEAWKEIISTDEHTLLLFVSPSGNGLKLFFRCNPVMPHEDSFRAAERYVLEHWGLTADPACKNVARLCFVSHDPDAYLNLDAEPLPYPPAPAEIAPAPSAVNTHTRHDFPADFISPGDDYNARGDWRTELKNAGWTFHGDHNLTRPGKTHGISATWDTLRDHPNRLYVFSSNAAPFSADSVYAPWHIYGLLHCAGNWKLTADTLYDLGFGTRRKPKPATPDPDAQAALDAANEETATAHASPPAEEPQSETPPSTLPFTLWRPSQFLAYKIDPNACLLGEGFIELGQWTSFIGIGGLGKTRLALYFVICQIINRPWCGLMTHGKPQKSVFLSTENGIRRWKTDLEKMLPAFTAPERAAIDDNLRILAMTPDEEGDMCLGNDETVLRLTITLLAESPGIVIFDPFADMVDGDENKAMDLVRTLRTLRRITRTACPSAAAIIIHHARTGAGNVAQAGDNFNAGNFGRGSKTLYSRVRCEIQLAPKDRDDSNSLVMACGKSNDCQKFDTRCVVFDPETFTYSIDPNFDIDAWRDDVAGKRKQSSISIEEIVAFVRTKCPLVGDEIDTKTIISEFEPSGTSERSLQRYLKNAIDAGYLRRGKKRWLIRLGSKPLPN